MKQVVPVQVEGAKSNGEPSAATVFFEMSDVEVVGGEVGWRDAAAGGTVPADEAGVSLSRAVDSVKPIAARIVEGFHSMGEAAPGEIEMTLGVKLSGKVGFFVAESHGEASIALKLKWKRG